MVNVWLKIVYKMTEDWTSTHTTLEPCLPLIS